MNATFTEGRRLASAQMLDGPAVLDQLRTIDPGVRMIATSGLGTSDRLKRAMATGARAFLQNPYSEEQLLDSLQQVLPPLNRLE
jgi:DNA-binding NtrC family response regulator